MTISKKLFNLAKTPLGDLIVGITFGTPLSKLLPVIRVKETKMVLAFWHPKPFWEKHIVIVPKKAIKSLTQANTEDFEYIKEIYKVAKEIVLELGWDKGEHSILINGGNRQDVNQIHVHLNSGKQLI